MGAKSTPAIEKAETLKSDYGLEYLGFRNLNQVYWNLSVDALYKEATFREECDCSETGPMKIDTGKYKSLVVNDRFIVREPETEDKINWGINNRPFSPDKFDIVYYRMLGFLQKRDLFVQDGFAGTDPNYQQPIRVITEKTWQSLYAKNILIPADIDTELPQFVPEFTIISVPSFQAQSEIDGTTSEAFVIINFERKLALIGGTAFAGEIKNVISSIVNYLLPYNNALTISCSASIGSKKDTALFFGDVDSGKTALISDSKRQLISNDISGWSDEGLFNIEGGLYSQLLTLSKDETPDRFACSEKFGTIIENSDSRDAQITCPIGYLKNTFNEKTADHPKNIFFLTCDSLGVLPLVSKLTTDQAMYHFMSGYTSVIKDEKPEITFDTCYGESLLVHSPYFYAEKLRNKINRYKVNCWLINTGWIGGQFGTGKQIDIKTVRTIINTIISNKLATVEFASDPIFAFEVPKTCDGISPELLNPSKSWADKKAYKTNYLQLAGFYIENFKKFDGEFPSKIVKAGPIKTDF